MKGSPKQELWVGALMLGAAALLGWMALKVGAVQGLEDRVSVTAVFDNVAGLEDGAAIAIAGVDVGRVNGLHIDFNKARVGMEINADAQVRQDVGVFLRARSVLGEKYIELVPASDTAPLLQDGALLTDTTGQLEIDQFVTGMEPMLDVLDSADLKDLLAALNQMARDDPERLARMADDAEVLLHNARLASEQAPELMVELRGALSEGRGAMAEVRELGREARPLIGRSEALLTELEALAKHSPELADRIPALVDQADLTLDETHALVQRLNGNTDRIERVLANLEEIDKWELRRLLREEGIKVRLLRSEVVPD